ncbi:S8 family serine peptidase [Actinoplanes sp. KI2]|uniref:S8 family serine peptidase n=1 Tax=Actinoplanes sp. KI2 TaxID=2983315 RepID=UPI0021D5E08E|nr:S8 family serine peptidase [Actinoplanes sp. KI2]MCU7723313.1 S8 family serine peptidase [Actinoplanes sp. KI2]
MRVLLGLLLAGGAVLPAVPAQAAIEPVAHTDAVRPDDPGYARQWGITRTHVNDAWSTVRGSSGVTIAIVDTGVNRLPDLAPRMLTGHDFVNDDDDPADDNGHGTMAAGVAAATGNNKTGVAGVCWSCKILPVKVLNAKGDGGYDTIAEGIRYAADQGAAIISLSLGGSEKSQILSDAVSYADQKGSLVVAAAGNAGSPLPHYPAAIPSVLSVGGVDQQDHRYSWSNYGSWVNVTAPGCNLAQRRDGVTDEYCGTSSATPFVAGVAGLLASTDPAPTAAQIRVALTGGRLDALRSLAALPYAGDKTKPVLAFGATPAQARGVVTVTAAAADQHGVSRVELYAGGKLIGTDVSAPYTFRWQSAPRNGVVPLDLRAYDRAGNLTQTRRYVRADNLAPAVKLAKAATSVTVRATDASGIARLELVVNGKVTSRYSGSVRKFSVPARAKNVQVRAYDKAGNVRVAGVRR